MTKEWDGKYETLSDPFLKRQFKFLNILGTSALESKDLEKVSEWWCFDVCCVVLWFVVCCVVLAIHSFKGSYCI